MTDFNKLPLPEQIGQLQKGDLVTTDAGAVLPCLNHNFKSIGLTVTLDCVAYVSTSNITAIHRPEPPVPDIVRDLIEFDETKYKHPVEALARLMRNYFEQEARK